MKRAWRQLKRRSKEMMKSNGDSRWTEVPAPVSQAMILICEKCGKKLSSDNEENPSRSLQQSLKEKIKENGDKGVLRALLTSCMDICPKGEIAVGISFSNATGGKDLFLTLKEALKEGGLQANVDAILEQARV
jgi:predicted metal-binding protein